MANLGCQFEIPGKRESQLKNCLRQIDRKASRGHFLGCWLMFLGCTTVGGTIPRQAWAV